MSAQHDTPRTQHTVAHGMRGPAPGRPAALGAETTTRPRDPQHLDARPLPPRRSATFATTMTAAAMGIAMLALGACTSPQRRPAHAEGAIPSESEPTERDGATLYAHYCALCHGDDGEGYAADDANALVHEGFLETYPDTFLRAAIADGRPGTAMAAYSQAHDGPLSRADIDTLVTWIRAQTGTAPRSFADEEAQRSSGQVGDPERGAPVYAARCAGCHGASGGGETALSLNNPVFLATATDAQIAHTIREGRQNTPMPGFADDLTEGQLSDVVALIRSWTVPITHVETRRPAEYRDLPLVIHPDGHTPDFELREGRYVSSADLSEAYRAGARLVILDARARSDWHGLHIPGAVPAPYYNVGRVIDRLPRDGTWIIAYCGCPHAASGRVRDALARNGFPNVAVLDEGIFRWAEMGYDVVYGD